MAPSPKRSVENKEAYKRDLKKSRKLIDEISSFQNDLGGSIVPYQRVSLYIFCALLFLGGLGLVIYAATQPNMDQVEDIKNQLYYGGGALMVVSFFALIIGYYWLKAVEGSRSLRQLNALQFETGFARDLFRNQGTNFT